jgi:hypothetical protein
MPDDSCPIIPVYLNQRIVFDLLAMLQDGLSQVAKITTTEADTDSIAREAGATFGVAQAFASLLRIDLSGKRTTTKESSGEVARSEERVHTPASLLFKLREMLVQRDHLSLLKSGDAIATRQIVEFTTTLRRNPVVELMDTMLSAFSMYMAFAEASSQKQGGGGKKSPQGSDNAKVVAQMKSFREALAAGPTIDIVSDVGDNGHATVITLEQEFLSDPTMSNLVEGEFVVIGKVIRVVDEDSSISLLRKTAMNVLPDETLSQMFTHFDALSAVQGYVLPKAEWRIHGPAVHILPVAIYA